MKFDNCRIVAEPYIVDAFCKCRTELKEVSSGLFASVMYCPKCENIYRLKLAKVPRNKVQAKFLEQCRKEVNK